MAMDKLTSVIVVVIVLVVLGGIGFMIRPRTVVDTTVETPSLALESPQVSPNPSPTPSMNVEPIAQTVTATISTSMGDIEVSLDGAKAPLTVGNFVQLAKSGFYNGTTFHRVIPDFMIQGGDPLSKDPAKRAMHGTGDPGYKFEDEINDRKLVQGSLAMANSGPNTNGSQFFIVTAKETPWLDGLHTNFGEVTKGMDVVLAIAKVQRDANDNPLTPVTVKSIVIRDLPGASPTGSAAPATSAKPTPSANPLSSPLGSTFKSSAGKTVVVPTPIETSAPSTSPDEF